ncbi:MAG: hypothetical protein ACP5EP_09670 [Acidobacteriaceae bacterium]
MQTKSILATALCFFFLGGSLCAVAQENTTAQGPTTAQDSTTGESPTAAQSSTATENTPTPDDIEAEQIAKARAEEYDRFERSKQMEEQLEYARQLRALGQYGAPAQNGHAQAQQPIQDSRTRAYSASNYDPARQNYDPAAGPNAQKQSWAGALDAATGHVNPCNHDWGGLLAQWHIAVAQETIENAYFYVCCIETIVLMLFVLWVSELREERRVRLVIAGDVVAQLYNQYVSARNKAYKYIHAYNRLVEQTEERLDALVRDGATDNEQTSGSPTSNITSTVPVNILNRQITSTPSARDPQQDEEHAATDADKTLSSSKIPIEALTKVKPSLPLTTSGHVGEFSSPETEVPNAPQSGDDISVEEELEAKRRQIETLQVRLQNKNLRINELEDALAVSSNRNKIPEL